MCGEEVEKIVIVEEEDGIDVVICLLIKMVVGLVYCLRKKKRKELFDFCVGKEKLIISLLNVVLIRRG